MVNNSININKRKENLNVDGHQFHQYQQNKTKFKQWWSTIPPISTKRTITVSLFFHNEILWQQNCIPLNCHDITVRNIVRDYKIGICCFSAKHAALRRKSEDWLAQNQVNVRVEQTILFIVLHDIHDDIYIHFSNVCLWAVFIVSRTSP
jgi:hypothetical protein